MIAKYAELITTTKAQYLNRRWGYHGCVKPLARLSLFMILPYMICPTMAVVCKDLDGTSYLVGQTLQLFFYLAWICLALYGISAFCLRLIKAAAKSC